MTKNSNNALWDYFKRGTRQNKLAECNFCHKFLSYRTTVTNLKQHLRYKHPGPHEDYLTRISGQRADQDHSDDPVSEKSSNDVTRHFERETGGRARCSLCQETVPYHEKNMIIHMKRWHELRTSDMKVENTFEDPIDETSFNEVVYLDEPFLNNSSSAVFRREKKTVLELSPKRRKRADSPTVSQQDEVDKFGAYVIHLLKSTPPELCTKLQMDIVSLIMSEKLKFAEKQKADMQNVRARQRSGEPRYIIRNISDDNFVLEHVGDAATAASASKEIANETSSEVNETVEKGKD